VEPVASAGDVGHAAVPAGAALLSTTTEPSLNAEHRTASVATVTAPAS
jgi:hypothetical protein